MRPCDFQQVAESLCPDQRRGGGCLWQQCSIDALRKLGKYRGHVIQAACMLGVPGKVHCRRLRRGYTNLSTCGVHATHRDFIHTLAGNEADADLAAEDRPSISSNQHLEFLRTMVRGAVELGRREKTCTVGQVLLCHQGRNELFSWQASQCTVFRRHDDVELAFRRGEIPLRHQPRQRLRGCVGRSTQHPPRLDGGEMMAPARGETIEQLSSTGLLGVRFHTRKMPLIGLYSKSFRIRSDSCV